MPPRRKRFILTDSIDRLAAELDLQQEEKSRAALEGITENKNAKAMGAYRPNPRSIEFLPSASQFRAAGQQYINSPNPPPEELLPLHFPPPPRSRPRPRVPPLQLPSTDQTHSPYTSPLGPRPPASPKHRDQKHLLPPSGDDARAITPPVNPPQETPPWTAARTAPQASLFHTRQRPSAITVGRTSSTRERPQPPLAPRNTDDKSFCLTK